MVTEVLDENFVLTRDGRLRTLDRPKKKRKKHLAPLMPRYTALTRDFIAGYKKLFPRHLYDDADRMCHGLFRDLYQVVAEYAVRSGKAAAPTPGTFCDVLLQYK